MLFDFNVKHEVDKKQGLTIVSVLRICLRKSSRAESRSAESLLNGNTSLFNSEHRPALCFFRALKTKTSVVKVLTERRTLLSGDTITHTHTDSGDAEESRTKSFTL